MSYYRLGFVVQGTTWGYVKASSPEVAAGEPLVYIEDRDLQLCDLHSPLVAGTKVSLLRLSTIEEVLDPDEIAEAQKFIEAGGW